MLTFGSLFAGIGGFDLGFERAGMTCKWQVEIDDYATKVLTKHWPDVTRWRDIRTFPPRPTSAWLGGQWRERWGVDVICGGFPCQDISNAGKRAGIRGSRSSLFFEAVRVVIELRPRIVVLENVAALLNRGLDVVLGTLAEIGYDAEWHCIPAAAVGAPHIRDRVFIVGYMGRHANSINDNPKRSRSFKDAISSGVSDRKNKGCQIPDPNCPRTAPSRDYSRMGRLKESIEEFRDNDTGRWSTEPNVGRVAHGIPSRVDRLRCLGNAVVPQVAEWIGRRIVENFNRSESCT